MVTSGREQGARPPGEHTEVVALTEELAALASPITSLVWCDRIGWCARRTGGVCGSASMRQMRARDRPEHVQVLAEQLNEHIAVHQPVFQPPNFKKQAQA